MFKNPFKSVICFLQALKAGALANVALRKSVQTLHREIFFQHFAASPRFQDPKRLFASSFKVYSEGNEDGMLEEIFHRIGVEDRRFVEIGIGDGLECNSAYLLLQGWSGCWIDCSSSGIAHARQNFGAFDVSLQQVSVTPDNADSIVLEASGGKPLDLLSIDIDSFDYYIWEAVRSVKPRVVIIEYNASLPPSVSKTIEFSSGDAPKVGTLYFGASLAALVKLARHKGYSLVGCSVTGVNAFFVRDDLVGDQFCEPLTAENHYEPPRYGLMAQIGHLPAAGPWRDV
jgi:hypothetical protein